MYINVLSRKKAIKFSNICTDNIIIISISTPNNAIPVFADNSNIKGIFRMSFYDIAYDVPEYNAPKQNDFIGLKNFIDTYKNSVNGIIVHCDAGISRSAGCAMAIADYVNCENIVRTQSHRFRPNYTVYDCTRKELGIYIDSKNSAFNNI